MISATQAVLVILKCRYLIPFRIIFGINNCHALLGFYLLVDSIEKPCVCSEPISQQNQAFKALTYGYALFSIDLGHKKFFLSLSKTKSFTFVVQIVQPAVYNETM